MGLHGIEGVCFCFLFFFFSSFFLSFFNPVSVTRRRDQYYKQLEMREYGLKFPLIYFKFSL